MKTRIVAALFALFLLLLLGACAAKEPFEEGERLSAAEIEALREELLRKRAEENENISHDGVYYWLDGGSVYHKTSTCSHIANKENVRSGSETEAHAAGKARVCASCGD